MVEWYEQYEKLKEWDSIYLLVLKIIELSLTDKSSLEKFESFLAWMHNDFRYSMICIIYTLFLFSSNRIRNMIKYDPKSSVSEKKKQIHNMTWDLFFMNYYFRKLQNKTDKEEFLLASDDKVILNILTAAININKSNDIESIKRYIVEKDYCLFDEYIKMQNLKTERQFDGKWFKNHNHRESLIEVLEEKLLK